MSWQDKEKYLREVLSQVKFSFDNESIKKELTLHLDERVEDYLIEGFTRKEAEDMALENFGDPIEIGKALNKEHSPFLGWMYLLSNTIAGIAMIFLVLALLPLGMSALEGNLSKQIPSENILYRIDVDEKVKIDDRVIHFDEVIYEKNGNLSIIYSVLQTRHFGMGWYVSSLGLITDETGKDYFIRSGSLSGGNIFSKRLEIVEDFPENAEKVIIEYDHYNRHYKVEIPLKAGALYE